MDVARIFSGRPVAESSLLVRCIFFSSRHRCMFRGGSEAPFAQTLLALCSYAVEQGRATDGLAGALAALRDVDAKHRLGVARCCAAEIALRHGDAGRACEYAAEAVEIAQLMARPSELVLAHTVLAQAAAVAGDEGTLQAQCDALASLPSRTISSSAQRALSDLHAEFGTVAKPENT